MLNGSSGRPDTSRRLFLRRSAVAVPAAVLAASAASEAQAGISPLNILPSLYVGWNKRNFHEIQSDENAHVAFLVSALGAMARPMPHFRNLEQPNAMIFAQTSRALENTGVGAYLGAAPIINSKAYLAAAGSILTIEARHAGYLDTLLNSPIVPQGANFDAPLTQDEVLAAAGPFIVDLNGGPPLGFSTTPSDMNDIAILNFALALEFLEAAFYNINVPKFLGFM